MCLLKKKLNNKKKKSLVFWFVSHCETPSKRENVVDELRKHIDIDIYGSCTRRFVNSKPDPCQTTTTTNKLKCFIDLFNSYKFYLAFENSNCDYYITEKYWKLYNVDYLFNVNVIPVVRGARLEHYERSAPSLTTHPKHHHHRSFIFADGFSTPKLLADYLVYLDGNDTAYFEYFEWKRTLVENFKHHLNNYNNNSNTDELGKRGRNWFRDDTTVFCEMCAKLHNETFMQGTNTVKISEFYNKDNDCRNGGENGRTSLIEFFFSLIGFCI
jgi:hypothetical protein